MATTDTVPGTADTTIDEARHTEEACAACAHPWAAHDAISTRFCTITVAKALTRGCACPRT
ncbi:MAG TPA: RGCVC family protein [Pseudonocardiaceae bacterium]|nr:RGCVC family protein [Pseudonocardiaceae bacterium]